MPLFKYSAVEERTGKKINAEIEAVDKEAAVNFIQEQNLTVLNIEEKKRGFGGNISLPFLNRVTMKHLVVFSRQFAVMLKATVPVVQSLKILVKQTVNPNLKIALNEIVDEVDGGMKLSQALGQHPKIFSDFFVAMIRSGETSGRLDEVLEYLADQQEKDYDLMSKIKGAMIYPVFIVCGLFAVGVVMMVVVIPKLTAILQESGGQLPVSTRILIGTSDFMTNFWWLLLLIIVALVVGFKYAIKTPQGKTYWDWLLIKLPVFGKLFQKIYLVRLARSLSTLSSGGLPLVEALGITSQIVGNRVYRKIIDKTIAEVQEGNTIASVFVEAKEIPTMVSYMISVGEQTGRLEVILEKLSNFYSREIDNMVANLVSLIEPLIMVVLGVAVGLMVAAIIMPMYNLASSM